MAERTSYSFFGFKYLFFTKKVYNLKQKHHGGRNMFYTYCDELSPKEARKNLEDFGYIYLI